MFSVSEKKLFVLDKIDQWFSNDQKDKAKQYLALLPAKSVYNWYLGLMATEDIHKKQFLESWLVWCTQFLNNAHSTKVLTELFLDHYPWCTLYTNTWCTVALSVKNLSESTTSSAQNLLLWAHAFFKPSALFQMQPENWEAYCKNWLDFCDIIQPDIALLCTPPAHTISFTIGSDYFPRCVSYLSQLNGPDRKVQLQLLDDFPSQLILNNIAMSGYRGPIANRLISNGVVPKIDVSLELIKKQLNLQSFISQVLIFAIQNRVEAFPHLLDFLKRLNFEKVENLNNEEKKIVGSIILNGLKATEETWNNLSSWLVLSKRVRNEFGIETLIALTEQAIDTVTQPIALLTKTAQLMLELVPYFNNMIGKNIKKEKVETQELPEDIFDLVSKFKSLDQLFMGLQDLRIKDYESRFPEKPIEQVFKEFLTPSPFLRFPCSEEELRLIFSEYEEVVKYATEYRDKSLEWLGVEGQRLGLLEQTREIKCRLLSIIRQAIRLEFGINPYNSQVLVVLAILNAPNNNVRKGRIAQVRTGEGKSQPLIAMLVAYEGCRGRTIDGISSNKYLAIRDFIKYRPFLWHFRIRCSHICHQNPEPKYFDAQVLFGTNTDFKFAIMRDAIYNMKLRFITNKKGIKEPRPFDVVIVDEVDNLFIDTALNSARIANPASRDVSWVYAPLWKMFQENSFLFSMATPNMLRAVLMNHQNGTFAVQAKKFSDLELTDWRNSAIIANHKKLDHDYILRESDDSNGALEVVIVDAKNAGRRMIGSRWSNGIHEFVEVKHNLPPERESHTVAALSHPEFFRLYKNIVGLTGTMGEDIERKEIVDVYKVDSFDTPPHKPCIRKEEPSQLTLNRQEHAEAIILEIKKQQDMMRPILVLFASIEESEKFSSILKERKIDHFVLNEKQKEDEDFIIAQAGESKQVTIATNMAGRGTDIILSSVSRDAGGLHVIFTFLPINIRVEEQGYGRSGRQGQPGTCHMILCINDPLISCLIPNKQNREALVGQSDFLDILREKRRSMVQKESEKRRAAAQREMVVFDFALKKFFDYLSDIRKSINSVDLSLIKVSIQKGSTAKREWLNNPEHPRYPHVLSFILKAKASIVETGCIHESFLELFQNTYIDLIIEEWAIFFTALTHDRVNVLSPYEHEDYVKKKFEYFKITKIGRTMANPGQDFCQWLSILSGQEEIKLEQQDSQITFTPQFSSSPFLELVPFNQETERKDSSNFSNKVISIN